MRMLLVTLRRIDEHGFARTKAEQQERYRNQGEFVEGLRESWEKLANRDLERNGYDARIDRWSLQEQVTSASRSSTNALPSRQWSATAPSPASAIRSADVSTITPNSKHLVPRNGRSTPRSSISKHGGRSAGRKTRRGARSATSTGAAGAVSRFCCARNRARGRTDAGGLGG